MRSYYSHLETQKNSGNLLLLGNKPTFRSSAIFPVFNKQNFSTRILFMGYWILKRNIKEITALISLRSEEGTLLSRTQLSITEPKCFRIEVADLLKDAKYDISNDFVGSLEVEFYSLSNMVFPYPAVVLNYYGPKFSTVVHTAQRVYNDVDDMMRNGQTEVPESGFNIYVDDDREPFLGIINGSTAVENSTLHLTFFKNTSETLNSTINLGHLAPYETRIIYPSREIDLKSFFRGEVGAAKVSFQVNWVFPRLIVGNVLKKLPGVVITHTYYDCTKANKESDYWFSPLNEWYPASLMVPATVQDDYYTNIFFYPIFSPSKLAIDVEIYGADGKRLGAKQDALILESPYKSLQRIQIKAVCEELNIPTNQPLGARIIARSLDKSISIPSRIKIGFDMGRGPNALPCNICTNLHPFDPQLENKPHTFRWAPILADQQKASLWILNSSPLVKYSREAEVNLTFHRESDASSLVRTISIPPNGFVKIELKDDPELIDFFQGKVGWVTAKTTNPYTTTFYFTENESGVIGGDHGF